LVYGGIISLNNKILRSNNLFLYKNKDLNKKIKKSGPYIHEKKIGSGGFGKKKIIIIIIKKKKGDIYLVFKKIKKKKVTHEITNKQYALKKIKLKVNNNEENKNSDEENENEENEEKRNDPNNKKSVFVPTDQFNEVNITKQLNHKNILKIENFFIQNSYSDSLYV
jgi:serine/threonine protein kinase